MTETVLTGLLSGIFTLVFGFGATLLSQRHARKVADLTMREERRREVRALIVKLTVPYPDDVTQRLIDSQCAQR